MRREVLSTAPAPDGGEIRLIRETGAVTIEINGRVLMSSRRFGSEEAMAKIACARLANHPAPRVLLGGLGLGFTLRAALDRLPPTAEVIQVELIEAIVDWHRGPFDLTTDRPLDDPRVTLVVGDVVELIEKHPEDAEPDLDAIVLDVDNGPIPITSVGNWWLYAREGIAAMHRRLRPGGILIVWSAGEDDRFAARMANAGFDTEVRYVVARTGKLRHKGKGETHVLFVGKR